MQVKITHVELLQGVDSPEQYNTRSYFEVMLHMLQMLFTTDGHGLLRLGTMHLW